MMGWIFNSTLKKTGIDRNILPSDTSLAAPSWNSGASVHPTAKLI